MVKTFIVQNLGCILGERVPIEDSDEAALPNGIKIKFPMMMSPTQTEQGKSKMAISVNPMFRDSLIFNPAYLVSESPVVKDLEDEYLRYLSSKTSGLILPPSFKLAD